MATSANAKKGDRPIPSPTKEAGPAHMGLKVTSRPASFRRGGYTFTGEARTIPMNKLTEEQALAIAEDSNLVSQIVDIEPDEEVVDDKK